MHRSKVLVCALSVVALLGAGCVARRVNLRQALSLTPPTSTSAADEVEDIDVEHSSSTVVATLRVGIDDKVTIRRAGQEFVGENNMQIAYGDGVSVTAGEATLSYPDTGITKLGQGTTLEVGVPAKDDGEGENSFFVRLHVTVGSIWTRLERLLGPTEAFQVSGSSVVATVRGTAFAFNVTDESVDVTVADHEIEITDENESATAIRMKPGEAFRAKLADLRAVRGTEADAIRKRFVRALTAAEKQRPVFRLMQQKVRGDLIQRPDKPVFLPVNPRVNKKILERLTPEQRRKFILRLRMSAD
ncbi:MAG TPA: hypothetical protein VN397_03410, partial [Candidatus Methylomirabilis sp.]|nr:hypothetical protein [Candidatus Methylomirabilis sp.]